MVIKTPLKHCLVSSNLKGIALEKLLILLTNTLPSFKIFMKGA